jgi:hypothetical protein
MNNSAEDVRFVTFSHPATIISPLIMPVASLKNPVRLPADLDSTLSPFPQHQVSSSNSSPPISVLDNLPMDNIAWPEVALATNVIIPGGSVPATLNFHGDKKLLAEMWEKMWFHKYARALMRQHIRSSEGPIAADATTHGGDHWSDLRRGKRGVWTGEGKVCSLQCTPSKSSNTHILRSRL